MAYCAPFGLYVTIQLGWLRRLFGVPLHPLWPLLATSVAFIAGAWLVANHTTGWMQVIMASLLAVLSVIMVRSLRGMS